MTYPCETGQQLSQPILYIRTHTSMVELPQTIGQAYARIMQYLGQLNQQPASEPYVAYYNMDMADLDVEMGFAVASPLAGDGDIQAGSFSEGPVATCLYTGPYAEMAPAYEELTQWISEHGCESTGVVYEFYLNEPGKVPPDQLQTRIVFPLKNN
jgi:effector-binding domain-containing protein